MHILRLLIYIQLLILQDLNAFMQGQAFTQYTRGVDVPSVVISQEETNRTEVIFQKFILLIHVISLIHISLLMLDGLIFTIFKVVGTI